MFFGRNDIKAETSVLWPPHVKSWLIGKDSDAGRDWGQEEKGTTEDEMAGWHHWLDGCEFEWNPGVGDGQGGLACCDSWGRKESDTTEWLNWNELKGKFRTGGQFQMSFIWRKIVQSVAIYSSGLISCIPRLETFSSLAVLFPVYQCTCLTRHFPQYSKAPFKNGWFPS